MPHDDEEREREREREIDLFKTSNVGDKDRPSACT
jgi:hypothetical protein